MVELYYIECDDCKTNVGDMLGPYIMNKFTGEYPVQVGPSPDKNKNCVSMVGSIIRDSRESSLIAGVGILVKACNIKAFKECWAVRGKYTLEKIKETCIRNKYEINYDDIALGDPGIIMPYFYPNYNTRNIKKKYKYGVILHYVDGMDGFQNRLLGENINFIDPALPVEKFIDELLLCENILSSSLHGIILSNAYKVPACWIRMNGTKLPKDDIKFHDYFSAIFEEEQKCYVIDRPIYVCEIPKEYYTRVADEFVDVQDKLYNKLQDKILSLVGKKSNFVYSLDDTTDIFKKLINGKKHFFMNRIGGNELDIYVKYVQNRRNISVINTEKFTKNIKKYAGYYDANDNPKNLKFFLDKYAESYSESDVVMVANSSLCSAYKYLLPTNNYYETTCSESFKNITTELIGDKTCIKFHYIESMNYINNWFSLLSGKRILIISPFTNEIQRQLKNKDNIFKGVGFQKIDFPEFKSVEYITMPLTMDGYNTPHKNWKGTYHNLCEQVRSKKKEFDIALLMCGCYSGPLGLYIKKIYRSAIYLGGIGQIMFGIKGSRYMIPYYTRFMNEHWTYPDISEDLKLDQNYCDNEGFKAYF